MIPETPEEVKANFELGLKLYKMGLAGKGLVDRGKDNTVDWAKRIVRGERITPEKARKMRAWFARHGSHTIEVPARLRQEKDFAKRMESGQKLVKAPALVAWYLWGGYEAQDWINSIDID